MKMSEVFIHKYTFIHNYNVKIEKNMLYNKSIYDIEHISNVLNNICKCQTLIRVLADMSAGPKKLYR